MANQLNNNSAFDLEIYYAGKVFLDDNNTSSTSNYILVSLNVKRKLILNMRVPPEDFSILWAILFVADAFLTPAKKTPGNTMTL